MGTYVSPVAQQNFVPQRVTVKSVWLNAVDNILQGAVPASGVYSPSFLYGNVNYTGPSGYLTSSSQFGYGETLPSPDGSSIPSILIGGAGKVKAQITTDAQAPGLAGITLYLSAGSAATPSSDAGGTLWLFGGGAYSGRAGDLRLQAGTSVNGDGADVQILGGNSTNGNAGNIYIIAGTNGLAGGNVKIYATNLNNVPGDISFWLGQPDIPHSIPLWTMSHTGALFPGNSGAGGAGDSLLSNGNLASPVWGQPGSIGAFLLSLSGGTLTIPQGTFGFFKIGNVVMIQTNSGVSANPTGPDDIILSTIPSNLRPSATRQVMCAALLNGSANGYFGVATISPLGSIVITLAIPTNAGTSLGYLPNNWSLAGAKGVSSGWMITYVI